MLADWSQKISKKGCSRSIADNTSFRIISGICFEVFRSQAYSNRVETVTILLFFHNYYAIKYHSSKNIRSRKKKGEKKKKEIVI